MFFQYVVFILCVSYAISELREYELGFKINENCDQNLLENDASSTRYQNFKNTALAEIRAVFANLTIKKKDSNSTEDLLWSVRLKEFVCDEKREAYMNIALNLRSKNSTWLSLIEHAKFFTGNFKTSYFEGAPVANHIIVKSKLINLHMCGLIHRSFKTHLVKHLYKSDGMSKLSVAQVIVLRHNCNDKEKQFDRGEFWFYVTNGNDIFVSEQQFSKLAYDVIEQMVYDGSTWKLGITLRKAITDVTFFGPGQDDDFSATELIYIGFGAVCALLLLIILIILIVSRCRGKSNASQDDEEKNVVSYSNAVYEEKDIKEKAMMKVYYENSIEKESQSSSEDVSSAENEKDEIPLPEVKITNDDEEAFDNHIEFHIPPPPPLETPVPSDYDETSRNGSPSQHSVVSIAPFNKLDLAERLENDDLRNKEFDNLECRMPTASLYPSDIESKNRLQSVYPWPESRVTLHHTDNSPGSDYINACYVKNRNGVMAYIASQSPMENTVNDFWKMVWEQNTVMIVMVTPLAMNKQELCHFYWPQDSNIQHYGDVSVHLRTKSTMTGYSITTMNVSSEGEERSVVLLRYNDWLEDTDIPRVPVNFITFLEDIITRKPTLPIIHCCSGAGMTAVSIALFDGMRELCEGNRVDLLQIIRRLRENLAGAIHTRMQYKFLLEALHEYAEDESAL